MDRLGAIQVFAQVVEAGSFAKAAERLGLSTSAASRHVAELESHLQTRLLNRTTRRVSLTESGRAFYERSVQLLADLAEAEQEASSAAVVPRGTIRLTTSVNFGVRHVAPAIAEFLARHPEVRFDVSLADRVQIGDIPLIAPEPVVERPGQGDGVVRRTLGHQHRSRKRRVRFPPAAAREHDTPRLQVEHRDHAQ